jgi:hypothetical protein
MHVKRSSARTPCFFTLEWWHPGTYTHWTVQWGLVPDGGNSVDSWSKHTPVYGLQNHCERLVVDGKAPGVHDENDLLMGQSHKFKLTGWVGSPHASDFKESEPSTKYKMAEARANVSEDVKRRAWARFHVVEELDEDGQLLGVPDIKVNDGDKGGMRCPMPCLGCNGAEKLDPFDLSSYHAFHVISYRYSSIVGNHTVSAGTLCLSAKRATTT